MTRYSAETHPSASIRSAAERRRLNGEDETKPARARRAPRPPAVEGWRKGLLRNGSGDPRPIEVNIVHALREHPKLAGRLRFNVLTQAGECAELPWRACTGWRAWTDLDDAELACWLQRQGIIVKPVVCATAVQVAAWDAQHDPVREYLEGVVWDGTPRLDTWAELYLGAKVEPGRERYLHQVSRKMMIQAVARACEPGVKADHVLILQGGQGVGKSRAIRALVPDETWFADEIGDLGSKDAAGDLRGKWILEMAELSAMRRSEVERVKAFATRQVDHYRPPYGRRSQDFPRRCVFVGTTNADAFLTDDTGNRRFWPVTVGRIDLAGLRQVRDQLWAEAVAAYKAGEDWWLDEETEALAITEQVERRVEDVWESRIIEWAERQVGAFTLAEALGNAVGVPLDRQDRSTQMRGAAALKVHGWVRKQQTSGKWVYQRPDNQPPPLVGDGVGYGKAKADQVDNQPNQPNQPISNSTQNPPHAKESDAKKDGWVGKVGYGPDSVGIDLTDPALLGIRGAGREGVTSGAAAG